MDWHAANNFIHVAFGSLALLGGALALVATKGSKLHIRGGQAFAVTMIAVLITTVYSLLYRFFPLVLVMILAEIYLIPSALLSVGRKREARLAWNWPLMALTVLLALFSAIQFVRLNLISEQLFIGPAVLTFMFAYLAFQDWRLLVRRERHPYFWLRRHLTRMILAFTFAVMALVRIGLDFGLTIEMTTVGPLLVAGIAIIAVYRRYPVPGARAPATDMPGQGP